MCKLMEGILQEFYTGKAMICKLKMHLDNMIKIQQEDPYSSSLAQVLITNTDVKMLPRIEKPHIHILCNTYILTFMIQIINDGPIHSWGKKKKKGFQNFLEGYSLQICT